MDKIAAAFVKAQTAFGPALKTSANPFFKSKYADLSVVIEAVIDALHSNGIALLQNCHESDAGVIVETIFMHESGETISCGKLSVPAAKNDPQGYGSALTYARRYSLMAACGIAPEDDDGNAASRPAPQAQPLKAVRLPALTEEEAEAAYKNWMEAKSILVDEDGNPDNDQITNAWGKMPSNVRTAIKKHAELIKVAEQTNEQAQQHLQSIKG